MKNLKVALVSLCLLLLVPFAVWRSRVAAQNRGPMIGVIEDQTPSHAASREQSCLEVAALSESAVDHAGGHPNARLSVWALGDASRAAEPVALTPQDTIPMRTMLSMGKDALHKQQRAYLVAIYDNCVHAPSPQYSAVYLAIERMLESLRVQGCMKGVECAIWVDSDGEENALLPLEQRLEGISPKRTDAVAPLDNTGISVHFCGLAETSVDPAKLTTSGDRRAIFRTHRAPDHVADVWRSIFNDPAGVSFAPFCPQPANRTDYIEPVEASKRAFTSSGTSRADPK